MSLKKWLNDHNLAVSAFGVSALVALLNIGSTGLYHSFTKLPYLLVEYQFQDWVARLGDSAPKDPRIYFLANDAPSHNLDQVWDEDFVASPILKKMKQPEWPRDVWAAILDRVAGSGAKVCGFDFMFQAPREGDPEFRAALDRHRDRAVIGSQLDDIKRGLTIRPQFNPPSKTLIDDASDPRVGFVNVWPDEDKILRSFRFHLNLKEEAGLPAEPGDPEFDSLAARMLAQAGYGDLVPKTREALRIRYAYKGETLRLQQGRSQSVADIFIPSLWEANYQSGAFFKDKIVLVGPEGNFTKDIGESPFGTIAGPEFHLNVMNAILTDSLLHESPVWLDMLLILFGGVLAALTGRAVRNPIVRVAGVLVFAAAFFWAAIQVFNRLDLVIPVFSPVLSLVGSSFGFIIWQQLIERLEKAKMRKTFERYVSRDVVKELLDNPASYLNTIGGARKKVTVLFSDVRGFTTMTESADAQTLVKQLNEYFDHMVNLVFANHGTLDKFIGDAVMAQWGGIYTEGEKMDAILAVRTAVQMRKRLAELNTKWVPEGMLDLKFGIGVNHGEAIVGNLGCEAKMEVSLIGDAVNTASRLEGITKEYHLDLLIGETVEPFVRDAFILRTVGLNQPKGKTVPLALYTVLDERQPGMPDPTWLAPYEEGVKLFRNREFAAAIERFEIALRDIPGDWLCEDYIHECRAYIAEPPPPDWNAVHVMKSK